MSDAASVIFEELAPVTSAMLEAGSRAAATMARRGMDRGDRRPLASDDEFLAAVWQAMLRAALFGGAA